MEVVMVMNGYCINSWVFYDVFLRYLLSFFWGYKNRLKFLFLCYVEILYSFVNIVGYVDDDLKDIL